MTNIQGQVSYDKKKNQSNGDELDPGGGSYDYKWRAKGPRVKGPRDIQWWKTFRRKKGDLTFNVTVLVKD